MIKGFRKACDQGKLIKIVGRVNQDFSLDYLDDYHVDSEKLSLENVNKLISYLNNDLISGYFF